MRNKDSIFKLTVVSFFIAIIIIQTFVPWLGYLPLGVANVTIIQATVIIGAVLLGPGPGAFLGLVWGGLAIVRNILQPTILSPVFINPLVALPGRILVGFLIGLLAKHWGQKRMANFAYGAIGSVINTVITMTLAYFFARDAIFQAMGIESEALFSFIIGIMAANGILEALVSSLLVGILSPPLVKLFQSKLRA